MMQANALSSRRIDAHVTMTPINIQYNNQSDFIVSFMYDIKLKHCTNLTNNIPISEKKLYDHEHNHAVLNFVNLL